MLGAVGWYELRLAAVTRALYSIIGSRLMIADMARLYTPTNNVEYNYIRISTIKINYYYY